MVTVFAGLQNCNILILQIPIIYLQSGTFIFQIYFIPPIMVGGLVDLLRWYKKKKGDPTKKEA